MEVEDFLSQLEKLIEEGKDEEAEKFVREFAKGKEDVVAELLMEIGIDIGDKGNHRKALIYFKLAKGISEREGDKITSSKLAAIAYSNLGNLLVDLKRFDEAEKAYRKAIEENPHYADAYSNLGVLLFDLKRFDEAEKAYRKAIEEDPHLADAYYNLGNLLVDLKRFDEAEKAYRKAIEEDPHLAGAYSNFGNLLVDLKRFDEAEKAYRKAMEEDPHSAEANGNLGTLFFKLAKYKEAKEQFGIADKKFFKNGRLTDSTRAKGLVNWVEARLLWDEKQWETSREHYIAASALFLETEEKRLAAVLKIMSEIIFISRDYREAINSEAVIEVRQKIAGVFSSFSEIFSQIKEIEFLDFELVKAQFKCIEVLNHALNFKNYDMESIENAREIFREYSFTTPLFAVNSLENFVTELKKYNSLDEILPEEGRNLLVILQPCDALDGIISKEVDRRGFEKYSKPILEAIEKSEQKIITKVEEESQKVITEIGLSKEEILNALNKQTELISEIKELNEKQPEQFRESIMEEFENDVKKTQEKGKIDKWEKEKKLISYGLTIIDFVANVIQIYSAVQGGQPEAAMKQGISLVGRCIERIKRG